MSLIMPQPTTAVRNFWIPIEINSFFSDVQVTGLGDLDEYIIRRMAPVDEANRKVFDNL